jgi:branched-chain amino acid transport system substrate-binding protein
MGARLGLLRRSEALRLTLAIVLAGGAVALGESLTGGHHRSSGSAHRGAAGGPASSSSSAGGAGAKAGGNPSSPAGSPSSVAGSPPGRVVVAGGPAVTRSLRRGSMTVVIDRPSSGLFAQQNRSIEQGAAVAVDELNAAGGLAHHVRVKLVPQSLDGLSAGAVRARLRSEAAAVLILPCDTDSQLTQAAGASQYGMLMLAPCNPDPTAGKRYPTYWPVGMGANDEALGLVGVMRTLGYRSAFVISTPESRSAELLTSYFRRAAQARGVQLTGSASIAMRARDFSGLARAVEASHLTPSTTIFTAAPPPFVNHLAVGLRAQGVHQPIVGTTALDTGLSLSSGAGALEDAVFPSYGFPREDAPARRFARDYARRSHSAPAGGFPGLGLETIRLLADAVRKAGSAEPSAVQRALSGGISLRGVGLADRAYLPGGDHNPIGQVGVTKIAFGNLVPLIATAPNGALSP